MLLNRGDISDECRHKTEVEVSKFHSWLPFPFPRKAARYRNRKHISVEKRPLLPSRLHVCHAIQTISFNNTAAKKYLHHQYRKYQHQHPTTVFYDRRADDRWNDDDILVCTSRSEAFRNRASDGPFGSGVEQFWIHLYTN